MGSKAIFKFLIFLLFAGLVGIATLLFVALGNMEAENDELLMTEEKLSYQIEKLTYERNYKREYFQRLLYDEDFAGRVIRQKLGFADPNEIVFRFEDSRPVRIDDPFTSPLKSEKATAKAHKNAKFPEPDSRAANSPTAAKDAAEQTEDGAAAEKPIAVRSKSLADYLMFWKSNSEDEKIASGSNAPVGSGSEVKVLDLPSIDIAAAKADRGQENTLPDSESIDAAREIDERYVLEDIAQRPRDRVKFITQGSSRLSTAPNIPPSAIVFSSGK